MQILVRPPRMRCLSDVLSWCVLGEPSVVVTKSAEFFSVLKYQPADLASSSPEQLVSARAGINRALAKFGRGWAFWFECQRNETAAYPDAAFPDPVSRLLDDERRSLFTATGAQFTSDFYITALYSPPDDAIGKVAAAFEQSDASERSDERRIVAEMDKFRRGIADIQKSLSFMRDVRLMEGADLLSYLHSTVSTKRHRIKMDALPIYLAERLADEEFLGGRRPMLGDHHLRCIRIKGLADETTPGIFDEINSLPFPFRRVARWLPFDRDDAEKELQARKAAWADRRVPLLRKITSRYFGDDGSRNNMDAEIRMQKADLALVSLASGDLSFGYWNETVNVSDPDVLVVEDRVKRVQAILEARGFSAPVATDDAMSVWVGSLPGHPHGDLGRFLGCSLSFADVMPGAAVWEGPERDHHLNGPALIRGFSDGGTPFNLCLHQDGSDVGHTLVIGQTGAGKSTMLGAMVAGHRKYHGSRVVVLDRGESAKVLTLALGGSFHALAADDASVSLQPLAFIDQPEELAWANEFTIGLLEQSRVNVIPAQKHEIAKALETLATRPGKQRTLSLLRAMVQDIEIKLGLAPFCLGGASGDLLDNDHHRLGDGADVCCFETAALLDRPSAAGPVLACVFHEIERSFDGRPTLLIIDEAWSALDHPLIAGKLRGWLKTARKANVAVVMATQSLADVASSTITEVLSESCPTRIFTANDRAQERETAKTYAAFGLTKEQIRIISELRAKSEYVFTAPGCWRKFELGLTPTELAFVGRSRPHDRKAVDRVMAAGPRETFAERWLSYCGVKDEAWGVAAE